MIQQMVGIYISGIPRYTKSDSMAYVIPLLNTCLILLTLFCRIGWRSKNAWAKTWFRSFPGFSVSFNKSSDCLSDSTIVGAYILSLYIYIYNCKYKCAYNRNTYIHIYIYIHIYANLAKKCRYVTACIANLVQKLDDKNGSLHILISGPRFSGSPCSKIAN